MDREVSRTLAELERKLHELERALSATGGLQGGYEPPHATPASPRPEHGDVRLVDEGEPGSMSRERHTSPRHTSTSQQPAPDYLQSSVPPAASADAPHGAAAERPAAFQAPQPPAGQSGSPGRSDAWPQQSSGFQEPAAGAGWQPPRPTGSAHSTSDRASEDRIDLAELTRFRDRLEHTVTELIAEYDRIISLRRVPGPAASSPAASGPAAPGPR